MIFIIIGIGAFILCSVALLVYLLYKYNKTDKLYYTELEKKMNAVAHTKILSTTAKTATTPLDLNEIFAAAKRNPSTRILFLVIYQDDMRDMVELSLSDPRCKALLTGYIEKLKR